MVFKELVGKEVLWTGEHRDEEGALTSYVLFSDKTCLYLPDPETGDSPRLLEDPINALDEIFGEKIGEALSTLELALVLRKLAFEEDGTPGDDEIGALLQPLLNKAADQGLRAQDKNPTCDTDEEVVTALAQPEGHVTSVVVHGSSEKEAERIAAEIVEAERELPCDD